MAFYVVLGILAILFLAGAYALYKMIMNPALQYHSFSYKVKAWLVFTFGHFRKLDFFPYFTTYGYDVHKMTFKEAREGSAVSRPGDIGIHRDNGFLSNVAIPGAFKHAWIVVDNNDCVEAVAEGVLRRDNLAPTYSDYVIILRPLGVNKTEVDASVQRANYLVGCEYDANFNFDLDEQSAAYMPRGFHKAFSCTEAAAFSWYHCKEKLAIVRSQHAGREAIIADDFLKMNFGIIWMSPSVTVKWAKEMKLHDIGVEKIKSYLEGNRDFNEHGNPIPRRR